MSQMGQNRKSSLRINITGLPGSGHPKISWTQALVGVDHPRRHVEVDFLDQEVDESPHSRWQPAAVAHIDNVDLLDIAGIVRLQHRNKSSRVDVKSDVEQGQARNALSGQRQA